MKGPSPMGASPIATPLRARNSIRGANFRILRQSISLGTDAANWA